MQAMLVDLALANFGNARCSLVWGAFMKPALCLCLSVEFIYTHDFHQTLSIVEMDR